ncbi:mu-type opioid receptor-like [Strongylocentrotus purpuratus]|uniref:G-protein coupled receptors family 1 profile domain-containing protein n=1 Tax=Strongylocentrotus purpuratus TaxID=7668 RepID=A0A7M7GJ13_STRPU|nr:mu-type opioid receptor-like [Strongylocentrotus purpuratus]|eukprot:XP_003729827.1 PREDICTED: mu-type opioid receptor-like [Strongylocentrotus purpuratus]
MEPLRGIFVAFYIVLMAVGIPGNLLVVLVTASRTPKKSIHVFVIALAVADLLACCLMPFGIHYWLTVNNQHSTILCKIHIFTSFVSVFTSMFLTNAVAFDRYFAVCYPLKTILNLPRSCKVCVGCFVSAFICSLPPVFAFDIRSYGPSVSLCTPTANQWLIEGIYGIIVFAFLLSTAVLIILYLQMCIMIRRQAHFRARVAPAPNPAPIHESPSPNDIQTISDKAPVASSSTNRPSEDYKVPESLSVHCSHGPHLAVPVTHAWSQSSYKSERTLRPLPEKTERQNRNPGVACAMADGIRNKTTKMLILSTVVFIASWLPNILIKAIPTTQYQGLSQSHPAILITNRAYYLENINIG